MKSFTLGHRIDSGVTTRVHIDHASQRLISEDVQSSETVQKILDANHEERLNGFRDTGGFRPYARVDIIQIYNWKAEYDKNERHDLTFPEWVAKRLEDGQYEKLRVTKYKS